MDRFIYSIGIRHIGQENAKILAAFFISINEFSKLFDEKKRKQILINLVDLDGIGETQVNSIDNFFSNERNTQISKNLIDELKIQNIKAKKQKESFLIKKIMFTGGFQNMSRSEAKSLAENNGGKVSRLYFKKIRFFSSWKL